MQQELLHIIPHQHQVAMSDRNRQKNHSSFVVWFTGLSGSGKSTLANKLEQYLFQRGIHTYVLDGDNIRTRLNKDLDFSEQGRVENIRRIAEVAKLMTDAGLVVITAFISPFQKDRMLAKELVGADRFIEVHVDCPLEICEERDVKGLYQKARAGVIKNFTGIDSPFEPPQSPDLVVNTGTKTIEENIEELVAVLQPKLLLP